MSGPVRASQPHSATHLLRTVRTTGGSAVLRWRGDGVVVELSGELDLTCRDQLAQVRDVLAGWSHRAVVDAAGVTFVDVSGLRAVLELVPPGGALLVLEPSPVLLRLVDLLHRATAWPPEVPAGPRQRSIVLRRPAPEPAQQLLPSGDRLPAVPRSRG